MAVAFEHLIDDHHRIDLLATKLERTVAENEIAPLNVDDLLNELERVVADHLRIEDGFIYPDLADCSDSGEPSALVLEFEILKRDWTAYLLAWRQGAAARDWQAFRSDTFGMLSRLRQRVMKETSLLYSMALREGVVVLRGNPIESTGLNTASIVVRQ